MHPRLPLYADFFFVFCLYMWFNILETSGDIVEGETHTQVEVKTQTPDKSLEDKKEKSLAVQIDCDGKKITTVSY